MKLRVAAFLFSLSPIAIAGQAYAQMTPEAAAALQQPIAVERDENATSVVLVPHMGKLAIHASLNGVERQFVFDTGSPSLISRNLADELSLEVIGTNTGRDANGRKVTTDIAIVDRLTIGGVAFRNVPVLIADFQTADPDRCFFDGGVIGSEIFPGSVWHIDAETQRLQIAKSLEDLGDRSAAGTAISARLHDFGYPHAPVFDYAVGSLEDRGLFDTGSSETITLFDRVAEDQRVKGAMVPNSIRKGRGSHGVSAAGAGAVTDLLRFEIDGVHLGDEDLGRNSGTTRNSPPSLIGLGILNTHDMTLDYPGERILLHPRDNVQAKAAHPGYALMRVGGEVRVVQLFDGSAAQRSGLKLGDRVVAIDGRNLLAEEAPCETMKWLVESRPTQSARRLTVLREGRPVTIDLED